MNSTPLLTVVVPAHNSNLHRLRQAFEGLTRQSLSPATWELLLVDNASTALPPPSAYADVAPAHLRIINEPRLGLAHARACGFRAARGDYVVLVDDDNILAPDYLANVVAIFSAHRQLGAIGGRSIPMFEVQPPPWAQEFFPLLALRDLGEKVVVSEGLRPPGATYNQYPHFAPIGAGMALRRAAWEAWLEERADGAAFTDRKGTDLTSGGDNDIVFCAMKKGWEVGYFPQLSLQHIIPPARLTDTYFARLNRGIQKSWMQLLSAHDANPWPNIGPLGAAMRKVKAWFVHRAWSSPKGHIRWQGACGHFEGRVVQARKSTKDPVT